MRVQSEPKCHSCGLHTEVCTFVGNLAKIFKKITAGNFQVHLAEAMVERVIYPPAPQ